MPLLPQAKRVRPPDWELVEASVLGEAGLVKEFRRTHSRSRATGIIKWVRNSKIVGQRGCILCGEIGPTWNRKWEMTKKATVWELEHRISHGLEPKMWGCVWGRDAKGKWQCLRLV